MSGQRANASSVKYSTMESPVGPITLASTERGVCWIDFGEGDRVIASLKQWCRRWLHTERVEPDEQANADAVEQLTAYFSGKRKDFDLPLDMRGTHFQLKVWNELHKIPYGETRSYKEIAEGIGAPKSVRAVGGANHQNPLSIIVPCHRVIGANGALVGYGGGLGIKAYLLSLEREHRSGATNGLGVP
ncbi:hypothetical protein BSNK01_12630 [Bacillaceae bacterium]